VRTTDGGIAVGNLEAKIRQLEGRPPGLELVSHLLVRSQFLGRPEDLDRALAVVESLPANDAEVLVARARVKARLHRFDEARADLKASGRTDEALDLSIAVALGEPDALARARALAERAPSLETLGTLASLTGDEAIFARALAGYHDVSPFAVAWLAVQEGLVLEAGSPARAAERFEDAHARLPVYAATVTHLAALLAARGDEARAAVLLRELAKTSTDPEIPGQLGLLLRKSAPDESARLLAEAHRGYDALLARHGAAYGAHAARFFLAAGEPARAVAAARLAPGPEGAQVLVEAALAAGDHPLACEAADRALVAPTPARRVLAWRAFTACGRTADAARVDEEL
jgi:hypothetical protein